jgi:hypothetical protein
MKRQSGVLLLNLKEMMMKDRKRNFIACLLGAAMLCSLPATAQEKSADAPKEKAAAEKASDAKAKKAAAEKNAAAKKKAAKKKAEAQAKKKQARAENESNKSSAESSSGLKVVDAKAALGVTEREPVDVATTFDAGDKVTVWAAIRNPGSPSDIKMVWFANDSEVSSMDIHIGESWRWRTWGKINVWEGDWKVEIQDEAGTVLKTVEFTVTAS